MDRGEYDKIDPLVQQIKELEARKQQTTSVPTPAPLPEADIVAEVYGGGKKTKKKNKTRKKKKTRKRNKTRKRKKTLKRNKRI